MLKETLVGVVVELPEEIAGTGIVLNAVKQRKDLYLATILTNQGDVLIAQVTNLEKAIGSKISYRDYKLYSHKIHELL